MAKKEKGFSVETESLKDFLRRVFLNGAVDSCVLEIDDEGFAEVYAVDVSNVLFLYVSEDLGIEDEMEIGLGNLDLLNKFVSTIKEDKVSVSIDKNRLVIARDKFGRLDYLLTSAELVPTALEEKEDTIEKLMDACTIEVILNADFAATLASYYSMVKAKEITLKYIDGNFYVVGGTDTGHKYEIPIDGEVNAVEGENEEDDFTVSVYGDFFLSILGVLDFDEEPKLMLAPNSPAVIVQGEDNENVWGIAPISIEGGGDED